MPTAVPRSRPLRQMGAGRKAGCVEVDGVLTVPGLVSAAVIPPDHFDRSLIYTAEFDQRGDGALQVAENAAGGSGAGGGPDHEHGCAADVNAGGARPHALGECADGDEVGKGLALTL